MPNTTEELGNWIDASAIAEAILDSLTDHEIPATLGNTKKVWLDFLGTELPDGLSNSVEALSDRNILEEPEEPEE